MGSSPLGQFNRMQSVTNTVKLREKERKKETKSRLEALIFSELKYQTVTEELYIV